MDKIELLLAHRADPNILLNERSSPDRTGTPGVGPLYYAVEQSNVPMAKALLEHNANPNVSAGRSGPPLLFKALEKLNVELVGLLLAHGADPNVRDGNATPLLWVTEKDPISAAALVGAPASTMLPEEEVGALQASHQLTIQDHQQTFSVDASESL